MSRTLAGGLALAACTVICAPAAKAQAELVFNGGFETGNFSGWFVPPIVFPPQPNPQYFLVSGGGGHSGERYAVLSSSTLQYVSQPLPTTAGQDYELSFWLRRSGGSPGPFVVRWEGAFVFNEFIQNPDFLTWQHFTVPLHANQTFSILEFGQDFFPGEFHIDDISVVQVPAPGATALLGVTGLGALARRRRRENHKPRWMCLGAIGLLGGASLASAQPDLVFNGGFETGNFSGWFVPPFIPNQQYFFVSVAGGHTGQNYARMSSSTLQYISQPLPTTAGQDYELSFWLRRSGGSPGPFVVRWEGAFVFNEFIQNPDFLTWRHFTVPLHANQTFSILEFGQNFFPGEFHIDDVSVVQVPAPGAAALLGVTGLGALARRRRRGRSLRVCDEDPGPRTQDPGLRPLTPRSSARPSATSPGPSCTRG